MLSLTLLDGGDEMKVAEFLESSGWSKAQLARHLGVTPAAVSQWEEIPEKWVQFCAVILSNLEFNPVEPPKPVKRVDPKEVTDLELLEVIRTRGEVSDFDICQTHGWRVWEFNQMISDLLKKYPVGDDFWGE